VRRGRLGSPAGCGRSAAGGSRGRARAGADDRALRNRRRPGAGSRPAPGRWSRLRG